MKVFLLAIVLSVLPVRGSAPHIVSQKTEVVKHSYASPTWERWITIKNPLAYPVWVFIECEHSLTVNPIGIPARRTSTITLPDIPAEDACLINHWQKKARNETPQWRP